MNGHDFTLEQNTEARMMLAVARRGLAAAINDAENGIGHLSCDDPKIMEQVRAHWRRLYDTYMNADALLSDLESCARHLTDGDNWEPNPIADGMKPMEMAKGCACFIAETPDGGLIIPSEPTPGENTAKRLANTLNALTGDVLLDATGIRLLGTQFLFAYHSRLDRPVDYGVNLTGMRFPDRLGLLDRADRHPGFLPLRPVVANGTGALERSGRELWAITARTLGRLPHGRFFVDLTMFADHPKILERFAVRYREIPERQPDRPGRGHHRPDRSRRPPRRHHQTEMGLSNGLCSNHVGWSQSSRTHSSGAAAQIERPEVGTIACGHRVHDRVLGAGFVAVVPRPIRFGRIFLMDLSNRAVRPPASVVGRKSIA